MKQVYSAEDVEGSDRQTVVLGHLPTSLFGGTIIVEELVVEERTTLGANAARANFDLSAEGTSLVSGESISSNTTAETFTPSNQYRTADNEALEFEIVDQASTSEQLDVSVIADTPSKEGFPTDL